MILKSFLVSGLLIIGVAAPISASAQSQIQPILIRPDRTHQNCQIYLKADGSQMLFKGKPDFGQLRVPLGLYARNGGARRGRHL